MNYEITTQIINCIESVLKSKYGVYYAGLFSLTTISLCYLLIDNKYGISSTKVTVQPYV